MLPAGWGEVGQQRVRDRFASGAQCIQCPAKVDRIPQGDRPYRVWNRAA